MKKIIYGFIALVALMAFQSCQKDDDEVFEKSAAQRIQEAVCGLTILVDHFTLY